MSVRFFYLALLLAIAGDRSVAQVDYVTGSLQGIVLDPQNRIVIAAKLTVVNEATGLSKRAVSTEAGYQIPSLAPGSYRVEISAPGFAKSVAQGVVLSVGHRTILNVQLELGAESTEVSVTTEISWLLPEQAQQANFINETQLQNLPNVSRNFMESIYTLPGVVNSFTPTLQNPGVGTGYQSSGFSVGGSNGRNNLVTIDGGENDYGSGTLRDSHVPIGSIQEIQVNRNAFEAEFGFTLGTAINMVTKGGTNQLHGSLSGYFHGRTLDSWKYLDRLLNPKRKPFQQSAIFSATLGGAFRKDRLFFFTAPEYQKLDSATVRNLSARPEFQPVASQPNGYDPATGACPNQRTPQQQVSQNCYLTQLANSGGSLSVLGAGLLAAPFFGNPLSNPVLKALVTGNEGTFNGIPVSPNGSGVRGLPGFNTPRGRYLNWVTRVDYIPTATDALAIRFGAVREADNVRPQPSYSGMQHLSDFTLTGTWTRTIGANLVNTVRVQAVPRNAASVEAPSPYGSEIDLGNQIQLGTPYSYPYFAYWKRFQFDESLAWVKGAHRMKFGGSWRPNYYDVVEELWFGGQWSFTDGTFSIRDISGLAPDSALAADLTRFNLSRGYPASGPASTNLTAVQAYLVGVPTLLLQADPASNTRWSAWTNSLGLYAQDSWKISPRLTANYGIRFDYGRDPAPVPSSFRVTPRVGIAWSPSADHKTVVRLGTGVFVAPNTFMLAFYNNLLGTSGKYINQNALVAGLPSPPFPSIFAAWAAQARKATPQFPNPGLSSAELRSLGISIAPPGPAAFGNFIYTISPDFEPAYTIQSSASIARELTRRWSIEVAYLRYRSVHVQQSLEANFVRDTSAPVDPFAGPAYVARPGTTVGQPNAFIFQNNMGTSSGNGNYNAGTVSLSRKLEHGFQLQANYTFARAIDDTSDYSSLSTPFRSDLPRLEKSLSYFDIRHSFVANAVYTTPVAALGRNRLRALSGITISPILYLRSGGPFSILVPGLVNGTIGHNANARPWYAGRNTGVGPGFFSTDVRASKTVLRQERRQLEVIVQAQNLFNRTNFASVNNNFPADPNYPLSGKGTLRDGPFDVKGLVPNSAAQLGRPLSFTEMFPARQVSLALRLQF